MYKVLTLMCIVAIVTGCSVLKPRSLNTPVPTPEAAFSYNLHAVTTDAEGNETINDGDTIQVSQQALEDNWSITLNRTYYDTTLMPREGMREFAGILKTHAETGNVPTDTQLLLYAGGIETLANYEIPLILSTEQADVQRSNKPDAFAQARIAQFQAQADVAKAQTDALERTAKRAIAATSPVAAGSNALEMLRDTVTNAPQSAEQ